MEIIIKSWESKNLRIPDMKIDLSDGMNFLQVPNGGGKTTLIDLIQATLSNNWQKFKAQDGGIRDFDELGDDITFPENGFFNLEIVWVDKNKKENIISFENNFNFKNNSKSTYTITNKGKKSGYRPSREVLPYLSESHINVFLFAGDDVDDYFEDGSQLAPVNNAIDSFSGIEGINSSLLKIDELFNQKNAAKSKTLNSTWQKKLTAVNRVIKSLNTHKSFLLKEKESNFVKWKEYHDRISNLDEMQKSHIEERNTLQKSFNEISDEIKNIESLISEKIRNPYFFSKELAKVTTSFLAGLQKAKLPGHAAEFFTEIANDDHCICGEQITKARKEHILSCKNNYLGQEHTDTVNRMKSESQRNIISCSEYPLDEDFVKLRAVEEERQELIQKLLILESKHKNSILSESEIIDYDLLGDKVKEFENKLQLIDKTKLSVPALRGLKISAIKEIETLADAERLEKLIQANMAQSSGYKEELDRKNTFKHLVQSGVELARLKICETLSDEINTTISKSLEKTFKVKSIDNKIRIHGKRKGGSMGQNVTTVTAFTTSLLSRTGVTYPLIVDHPVMPVELESRGQISKMMISSNSQIITLVINSEKDGFIFKAGTKDIHSYLKNSRFITMSRTDRDVDVGKIPKNDKTFETKNGIVSYDIDFFKKFVLEGKISDV